MKTIALGRINSAISMYLYYEGPKVILSTKAYNIDIYKYNFQVKMILSHLEADY
jgi:hypothetical protein